MKIIPFLTVLLCFASIQLFSQTKMIAHKSHSGNGENFTIAINNNLFDMDDSNFGLPPKVNATSLDSVVYASNSSAIIVTSEYYGYKVGKKIEDKVFLRRKRDTIYFHSNRHPLNSVKKIIKQKYVFENSIDSVKYIGYDSASKNSKTRNKKNYIIPLQINDNGNSPPIDYTIFAIVAMIGVFSLLIGTFSWKLMNLQKV